MSDKGLEAFEAALKADEELRTKFEEALRAATDARSDGEAVQKAAAQLGFEVTLEELEQAWAARQEVDVDELDSVAGGLVDHNKEWCLFDWHCYTAVAHDTVKGKHNEACWSDYYCAIFYHH